MQKVLPKCLLMECIVQALSLLSSRHTMLAPPHHPVLWVGWGSTAGLKAGSWEPTRMKRKLLHGCYQPCKSASLAPRAARDGAGTAGLGLAHPNSFLW